MRTGSLGTASTIVIRPLPTSEFPAQVKLAPMSDAALWNAVFADSSARIEADFRATETAVTSVYSFETAFRCPACPRGGEPAESPGRPHGRDGAARVPSPS
jgi:hypothetical protein